MPQNRRLAFVGIAKQTAKGSPAASPTYGFGVLGGAIVGLEVEQESDSITYLKRVSPDENRVAVNPGVAFRTRLWPRSGPALLYGALGAIATTGVGPYTHVATPADDLPYWSVFVRYGSDYHRFVDCKFDQITISWSERRPLEVEAVLLGTGVDLYQAAWSAANDEANEPKFRPPGGTFKLHASSATPVTAKMSAGRIQIQNGLAGIPLSASLQPDNVYPGEMVLECSFTLIPDDFTEWRRALTGADAGTSVSDDPVYGSFEVQLVQGSSSAKFEASRVAFLGEFPEADPAGGAAELVMAGRAKQPTTGDALKATFVNGVASY